MIFLSYSSKNEKLAFTIFEEVVHLGLEIWFAPKSIKVGESYNAVISKAIKESKYMILILSKDSIDSPHVSREIGLAIKNRITIYPIKIDDCVLNESFEYFLENIQWYQIYENNDFTINVNNFLKQVFIEQKNPSLSANTIKNSDVSIIKETKELFKLVYEDLDESIEKYLTEAILIDSQYYTDELTGQLKICLDWYYEDNYIYIFVINEENKVIGYINSMLVDKETFNSILQGNFIDMNISKESIIQAFMPGVYNMYFCSIAIDNNYKKYKNKIFKLLYNGFFQKLLNLAEEGCFIEEIVADAVTHEGKNLAESFNLKEVLSTSHDSRIYHAKLLPPEFKYYEGITKDVYKLYRDYFDNYNNV